MIGSCVLCCGCLRHPRDTDAPEHSQLCLPDLGREDTELKVEYRESLTTLYARILDQATAVCHFARNTLLRTIRSTLQLEDWSKLLEDVNAKDITCKELTDVFNSQDQRAGMLLLKEALEQNDSKLQDVLNHLRSSQEIISGF